MKVGAVILAAGASTRFGGIKQIAPLGDKALLQHVINRAESSNLEKVVVVLGAFIDEIVEKIKVAPTTLVIQNREWAAGQSTSIHLGVEAIENACDGILFLQGDQPFVSSALIQKEMELASNSGAEIVAPVFEGQRGTPVLFTKSCFNELKGLKGDGGGRTLFGSHHLTTFDWAIHTEGMDVDTVDDYEKAQLIINSHSHLCTIILSAGLSTRMKKPKLLLPWGESSVLGAVIQSFQNAGVNEIKVVTGGYREEVAKEALKFGAMSVFNPNFANGEMVDSIQAGLTSVMGTKYQAAFVALGDQPGVSSKDILEIAKCYFDTRAPLIIPSYQMRRGHPWLVSRELWQNLLGLKRPRTMHDFIEANREKITYQVIHNPGILQDLDTPEDYEKYKPG